MTENMKKLLELVTQNTELQEKLNNVAKENLIVLAAEHGVVLTEADFETSQGNISDDDLDAVAGGDECACVMGGGGASHYGKNYQSKTCACVGGGGGQTASGICRCACVLGGYGEDIVYKVQ